MTKETKFTPGPWDASGLTVYDTCMDSVASTHNAADARLIAAAPELYEALEAMLDEHDEGHGISHSTANMAMDVIAKARGHD